VPFLPWQYSPTVVAAIALAGLTYVAALLIWMWPPVTFDVMLSNGLYKLMSWTVFAGALPFWFSPVPLSLCQSEIYTLCRPPVAACCPSRPSRTNSLAVRSCGSLAR
jgi:uncharacterized protein (DUF2062 family)